jgi:hypothetical protein
MVKKYQTVEDILKYSLLCRTRTEFRLKYQGPYNLARKLSVLDKVCEHMLTKTYSTPQLILKKIMETILNDKCLYNCRTIIKPYEIDVYFDNYKIGFEYDGKRWHKNDYVNKKKLCLNKNITLITIKENSKDYETDIKNQLIFNLHIINKITNKKIINSDIINVKINYYELIPNLSEIQKICLSYDDLGDFIKKEKSLYVLLHKRKLLRNFTSHMTTSRTYYGDINIKEIVNKYDTISEFIRYESKLYQHIKKHKLDDLLNNLKRKIVPWTKESINCEILKYEYLEDFKKNTGGGYNSAIKLGMFLEIKKLKLKRNSYSLNEINIVISKYSKLIDFINNDYNIYTYCLKNKLCHLYSHMDKRKKWTETELIEIVNRYNTVKELSINNPLAYTCIRKRHKHLLKNLKKYIK